MREAKGIGKAIRRMRLERGWSQAVLAKRAGFHVHRKPCGVENSPTVGFHECGSTSPNMRSLQKYAKAFGCKVSDLTGDTPLRPESVSLTDLLTAAEVCESEGKYEAACVLRRIAQDATKAGEPREEE